MINIKRTVALLSILVLLILIVVGVIFVRNYNSDLNISNGSKTKNYSPVYSLIPFNINLQSPENVEINIKTIRRHLNLMKKYGLKADYYFTWSALKQIMEKDPSLIDEIKDAGMDIHHHGANRPPGEWLVDRLEGKSWKEDVQIAMDYMTHDIDPDTGEILSSPGGLLKMKQMLNLDFFSTGRFFEAPILYVAKKLGAKMCVGLKGNTGAPIADAWFMGVLNRPEDFGLSYKVFINGDDENAINRMEAVLSTRKVDEPFFITIPVHDHDFYLFRPGGGNFGQRKGGETKLFERSDEANDPPIFSATIKNGKILKNRQGIKENKDELLSESRQEEIWKSYESVISWLASNDTVQNITMREVYSMAENDLEPVVTKATVERIADELSTATSLPDYLSVDGQFFSLADSFQALYTSLSRYYKDGTFPDSIEIDSSLIGPTEDYSGIDRSIKVSIEDILKTADNIANSGEEGVPSRIKVGAYTVNSAEFLIAMAQSVEELTSKDISGELTIKDIQMLPLSASNNSKVSIFTRLQFWTLRPVRWKGFASSSPLSGEVLSGETAKKETIGKQQPIYVVFNIHFDPISSSLRAFNKEGPNPESLYKERKEGMRWLSNFLDELEKEGGIDSVVRVNLQLGGDQAEYYMEDEDGLSILKKFYNKGIHTFGVHFHNNERDSEFNWPVVEMARSRTDIESDRKRVTEDHIDVVDKLMGMIIDSSDTKKIREVNHNILGHMLDKELAMEKGFYIITGGENEKFNNFFDHDVYNPWRPSQEWALAEDMNTPYVLIPQAPAIGRIGAHISQKEGSKSMRSGGMEIGIWQDNSVSAMKRKFLHLYLEWLWWKRTEPDGKIWTFGWTLHANNLLGDDGRYGEKDYLRDELVEFVKWLNENFIGKKTSDGSTIAVYSNMDEIYQHYIDWENTHPGKSSFSYPYKETNWDAYPYKLKGLAEELMYSHYAGEIDKYKNIGVKIYKLIRTDGQNWTFKDGKDYSNGSTQDIYLVFSEKGKHAIDLTYLFSGEVRVVNGLDGSVEKTNADKIEVGETPIVVFK